MTRGTLARLAAGALLVPWGCGGGAPVEYPAGGTVPVGQASFALEQVWAEEVADRLELSLHLRVELPTRTVRGPNAKAMEAILVARLVDSAGGRHRPMGLPLPEPIAAYRRSGVDYGADYERAMADARKVNEAMTTGELPEEWTRWVVVYSVPRDVGPLRLLVKNPDRRRGQARLIAVPVRT